MSEALIGINDVEFEKLVSRGLARPDSTVTGDEAIDALGDLDPTPEIIERLRSLLVERGVVLDDAVPLASDIDALDDEGSDGEVKEVNKNLSDDPSLINSDPEGKGWIMKVKTN